MLVSVNFVGAMSTKNKEPVRIEEKGSYYVLSVDDFEKIDEFLDSIQDPVKRQRAREIFDSILTKDGKIDLSVAEDLSSTYYENINSRIGSIYNNDCSECQEYKVSNSNINSLGTSSGTKTVFTAPYWGCFSWGEGTNLADEHSYGCNRYSGSVGAYANAWVGGATAEAMQKQGFYVGRTKTVSIDAKIVRTGGAATFGLGAFAGTTKTWSWDDFSDNYHQADVDCWLGWDTVILKIIGLVGLIVGTIPGDIAQAISLLATMADFEALAIQLDDMLDDGDAEILHIKFSFSASPGTHNIWVGLRASASACITGTGCAVTMGQVSKITIDGIAAPNAPTITGPSSGIVDTSYEFCAKSTDPNSDKVQYKFIWDDGSSTSWTDLKNSGTKVCKSHKYDSEGTYDVKVMVMDIDQMTSESTHKIVIGENQAPKVPSLSSEKVSGGSYRFTAKATDPDGHKIRYIFKESDGEQKTTGYVSSGTSASKTFDKFPYPEVKVRAEDEMGKMSGWSDYKVRSKDYNLGLNLFNNLLQNFPNLYLLIHILGLN
jgi:hypothetical protein